MSFRERIRIELPIDKEKERESLVEIFRRSSVGKKYKLSNIILFACLIIMMVISCAATAWLWKDHLIIVFYFILFIITATLCGYFSLIDVVKQMASSPIGHVPMLEGKVILIFTPVGVKIANDNMKIFVKWEAYKTISISPTQIVILGDTAYGIILNNNEVVGRDNFGRLALMLRRVPSLRE
jgi:hypothetical protein